MHLLQLAWMMKAYLMMAATHRSSQKGVVVGRFQPLHIGHVAYITKALELSDYLYIGITTPGETATQYEPNDQSRLGLQNNPFTFLERKTMITITLDDLAIPHSQYTCIHFDPNQVKDWYSAVPHDATYYLLLLSEAENLKVSAMQAKGLRVEVLDMVEERLHMGGDIRQKIINQDNWEDLVPPAVAVYLKSINAKERLMALQNKKA